MGSPTMVISSLEKGLALALAASLLAASFGWMQASHYKAQYKTTLDSLTIIEDRVKTQNEEATKLFNELIKEKNALEEELKQKAKEQEQKDERAKKQIQDLERDFSNRPFRVRVVPSNCGTGGSSPEGGGTSVTENHGGGEAQGTGLLPEKNRDLLNRALTEVEMLSAAYNSCYERVMLKRP